METIKNYLDSLFLNVPENPETTKAKADLLATMEDHYYALIDEGKSQNEAIGSVISEFGSIDELLEELEVQKQQQTESEDNTYSTDSYPILLTEAEHYWSIIRKFALKISLGVLLCCMAVSSIIFLSGGYATNTGLILFFPLVAVAVIFFIVGGMSFSEETKKVADRPIPMDVKQAAAFHVAEYKKSFNVSLLIGIFLCIVSFVPIFLFSNAYNEHFGISLFLMTAGLGAFMIIYGSIVYSYYRKFADQTIYIPDEDEPGPNARRAIYGDESHPMVAFIEKIFWPIVLVIYFGWSFIFGTWAYSWLIFIVAGPLFEGLKNLFRIQE